MKTIININGDDIEITLTPEQIQKIKKYSVKVTERIKTFEDVLEDQNVTMEAFIRRIENDTEDEAAYKRMKLISRALNELKEGEELDPSKTWYTPYFNRDSGPGFSRSYYDYLHTFTCVGARLSFKSSELAIYAGNTFPEIYKPFMVIIK
jgi:hypothetical protein